ncbi:glycosyltransferase family 2 protein [Desulfobacterium sp. N47]|uniref:Glycosyltransferase 2-like domain-containing protein n=1 Tax=uncultured Desulfobacterium sp. TaxID=201089 RepID=E1YCC3_9BACT|nr:hypothetical protein N47_G35410 [uncultured Desulfobacterium sp.]
MPKDLSDFQTDKKSYYTFSVVTPSYNHGKFIAETIESVLSQEGDFGIDYIIMDGGSNDETISIIKKYEDLMNNRKWKTRCNFIKYRWVTNKDKGQADAINKGFEIAVGDIYSFLNSDDIYEPCAFKTISEKFKSLQNIDIIYGNAFYINEISDIQGMYPSEDINRFNIFSCCFICQPALFMKKDVYQHVGRFNININNSFDYEYWLRIAATKKFRFEYIRPILAASRMHKKNKTSLNRKEIYLEYFALMKIYNQKNDGKMRIGFVYDTSRFIKAISYIFEVISKVSH